MDNRDILNTALAQSAVDYGCSPGDFLRSEPTVVLSQKREGARCYLPLPLTCSLVSYGGCVVAQTSEPLLAPVREFLLRYPPEHCFETPNLYELNRILTPYDHRVCFMAEYFLPDLDRLQRLPCPYPTRVLTQEEFAELCSFLQETQIERVGVFEFSPEEGTEAAELPDQIDAETKANRRLIVEELQSGVLDDYNTSRHGETMDVLCEGFDEEQQLWFGRTYADSVEVDGHVYFEGDGEPQEGEFVSVRITESLGPDLLGVQQKGE